MVVVGIVVYRDIFLDLQILTTSNNNNCIITIIACEMIDVRLLTKQMYNG